ncbi:MAG: PQQ-binding-like beta-propeller repeat protein [Pseudomonadota bacterium]
MTIWFNRTGLKAGAASLAAVSLAGCAAIASLNDAVAEPEAAEPVADQPAPLAGPVTDALLENPPAESWLMWRGNHKSWGYSALDQVNLDNVGDLDLAWSVVMDPGSSQPTPLVHDGVLYLPNSKDHITAHDATSGDLIWSYKHERTGEVWGSGDITRNMAIYDGKIFHAAGDARLIALDAKTGELIWDTLTGDPAITTHSSGPIVGGGRVFSGRVCRYAPPARCNVMAHDAQTGELLWKTDVIPSPGEPGDESWNGIPFEERAHGSTWLPGSYDAELNLLYWPTSGPSPSPEAMRDNIPADMRYTNSTLALDPATGEIKWDVQHLPRDNWDTDHTYERILVDAEVRPDADSVWKVNPDLPEGTKKLITGIPGKTGIVWTIDRETGEFYWAKQTTFQNVVADIDGETGKVTVNEESVLTEIEGEPKLVCPSMAGGRDWYAGAYAPEAKTMFMPMLNLCMDVVASPKDPRYGLLPKFVKTPGEEHLGRLEAIDVETGETRWINESRHGVLSVLSTGGDLLFAGDTNRRFRAYDQATGDVVWETILGGPVSGFPISYAVNGEQYIAVAAGSGGAVPLWAMLSGVRSLPPGGNALYVFKLGE